MKELYSTLFLRVCCSVRCSVPRVADVCVAVMWWDHHVKPTQHDTQSGASAVLVIAMMIMMENNLN